MPPPSVDSNFLFLGSTSEQPVTTESMMHSDILTQHVGNNVVTQLIVANEVNQQPDFVVPATSTQDLPVPATSVEEFVVPISNNHEFVVPVSMSVSPAPFRSSSDSMEVATFSSKFMLLLPGTSRIVYEDIIIKSRKT